MRCTFGTFHSRLTRIWKVLFLPRQRSSIATSIILSLFLQKPVVFYINHKNMQDKGVSFTYNSIHFPIYSRCGIPGSQYPVSLFSPISCWMSHYRTILYSWSPSLLAFSFVLLLTAPSKCSSLMSHALLLCGSLLLISTFLIKVLEIPPFCIEKELDLCEVQQGLSSRRVKVWQLVMHFLNRRKFCSNIFVLHLQSCNAEIQIKRNQSLKHLSKQIVLSFSNPVLIVFCIIVLISSSWIY